MTSQSPIVFLSGAGLPAWIWDDVRATLSVDSIVASYPKEDGATLNGYVEAVLGQIRWPVFTVVAHSAGGVVATVLMGRAPERVEGFVAVSASLPAAGQSFFSALPFPQNVILPLIVRMAGTRPPEKAMRSGIGHGLDERLVDRIVRDFEPESQRFYRDKVGASSYPSRSGYIVTQADREFPVSMQEQFRKRLGSGWTRGIDTGHLPMLEAPAILSGLIAEFLGGRK